VGEIARIWQCAPTVPVVALVYEVELVVELARPKMRRRGPAHRPDRRPLQVRSLGHSNHTNERALASVPIRAERREIPRIRGADG